MKLIKDTNMILTDTVVKGDILFSDNIIEIYLTMDGKDRQYSFDSVEIINGEGMYLSPGFIDLHIHGSAGFDTMDASYLALNNISKSLARTGVTSFLPTTMTMDTEKIIEALENIRIARNKGVAGAEILGAHLEGPFINPKYKGAQNEINIITPDSRVFTDYHDIIKNVTLAPEMDGAKELIMHLTENDIMVSIGHTAATYDEVVQAKKWGATHITHLFNAMLGLHHREPGTVGGALYLDYSCELIADLIHLHPAIINLVLSIKDPDRVILVTDQMMAGTLEDGEYELGGQHVFVRDGAARLSNGNLAGSTLTIDQAVRNLKAISDLALPQIIGMVTVNPARLLNIQEQYGKIARGYRADLVLMDKDLNINRVFIRGKEVAF